MKKRLGCLHAHYSNIEYIENALAPFDTELVHFVDPGLMDRLTSDKNFQGVDAQHKVKAQIEWIAQSKVDAVLITCTNYIVILQEVQLSVSVPKFMGKIMYGISFIIVLFGLSELLENQIIFTIGLILILSLIIFALIYSNTRNRFKK